VSGWRFDADCRLRLGTPIALGAHCELSGLASDCQRPDPALRRRDVSGLPMAEQDVL
jgi:hypothetical protein